MDRRKGMRKMRTTVSKSPRWIGWILLGLVLSLALAAPAMAQVLEAGGTDRYWALPAPKAAQEGLQAKRIVKVWVTPKKATVMKGDLYALPGTVYYSYRNEDDAAGFTVTSAKESVAQVVSIDGKPYAYAVGAGKAKLTYTLYTYNGASKKCSFTLTVKEPKVTGLSLPSTSSSLKVGESLTLSPVVSPANADQRVRYKSSNAKIASVNADGVVTGVSQGTATITISSWDKKKKVSCTIFVQDTIARRGIVIVECSGTNGTYTSPDQILGERLASTVNLKGMASLFKKQGIAAATLENPASKETAKQAIRSALAGADGDDVSYVYLNGHGGILNNQYCIALSPNSTSASSVLSASELRSLLDGIPGTKVVILESCFSGNAIGKGGDSFAQGFVDEFTAGGALSKSGELAGSNYYVMCSTVGSAQSVSFYNSKMLGKKNFSGGIFTYGLAKGAGWDIVSKKSVAAAADANKDKLVTLEELSLYSQKIVDQGMKAFSASQGLQLSQRIAVYPANSGYPVFKG